MSIFDATSFVTDARIRIDVDRCFFASNNFTPKFVPGRARNSAKARHQLEQDCSSPSIRYSVPFPAKQSSKSTTQLQLFKRFTPCSFPESGDRIGFKISQSPQFRGIRKCRIVGFEPGRQGSPATTVAKEKRRDSPDVEAILT